MSDWKKRSLEIGGDASVPPGAVTCCVRAFIPMPPGAPTAEVPDDVLCRPFVITSVDCERDDFTVVGFSVGPRWFSVDTVVEVELGQVVAVWARNDGDKVRRFSGKIIGKERVED